MTDHGPLGTPDPQHRPNHRNHSDQPNHQDADDTRELLAAFVLHAVDDDERARVEALIAVDPDARAEVTRYEDAIAALAADDVAVVPPDGAWSAIQARLAVSSRPPAVDAAGPDADAAQSSPPAAADDPEPSAAVVPLEGHRPSGRATAARRAAGRSRWRFVAAAAAVVALLVAAAGVVGLSQRSESRSSELVEALQAPTTRVATMSGSAGEARVVLTADGRGFLTTSGLAPPADGKVYQLWSGDSGTMVSLGVVEDGGIARFEAPAGSRQLALSLETRPGAQQPTLPPVAVGEVA